MNRFWEIIVTSRGRDRFYCFPFLLMLSIITPIYQMISRIVLRRRRCHRSGGWNGAVISVGGLTVGGSGKTPIIGWLAGYFLRAGKSVTIVHSGYGRRDRTPLIIPAGQKASVAQAGDETAMLMKLWPGAAFAVGADKKKMVARADQVLNPEIILIDDGYQRLDIEKRIDIAVVRPELFLQNAGVHRRLRLFPSGILREPLSALARADAVFIAVDEQTPIDTIKDEIRCYSPNVPVIVWHFRLNGAVREGGLIANEELRSRRLFLFAGIGSYDRLRRMLSGVGIVPVGDYNFGDHYDYDQMDFAMLKTLSDAARAEGYLTTAKDGVRLPVGGLDKPVYCLALEVVPESESEIERLLGGHGV